MLCRLGSTIYMLNMSTSRSSWLSLKSCLFRPCCGAFPRDGRQVILNRLGGVKPQLGISWQSGQKRDSEPGKLPWLAVFVLRLLRLTQMSEAPTFGSILTAGPMVLETVMERK